MITDSQRDKIVTDLLNENPTGPLWPLKFCESSNSEFGYSDQILFALELHSKWAVDRYLTDRYFGSPSERGWKPIPQEDAVVHKERVNLVWSRIEESIKTMWRTGGIGIYRVSAGKYFGTLKLGHVWANDKESAQLLADMCFSYTLNDLSINNEELNKIYVQYCSANGPEEIDGLNKTIEGELVRKRDEIIKVVETADDVLRCIDIRIKAMKIVQESMN